MGKGKDTGKPSSAVSGSSGLFDRMPGSQNGSESDAWKSMFSNGANLLASVHDSNRQQPMPLQSVDLSPVSNDMSSSPLMSKLLEQNDQPHMSSTALPWTAQADSIVKKRKPQDNTSLGLGQLISLLGQAQTGMISANREPTPAKEGFVRSIIGAVLGAL